MKKKLNTISYAVTAVLTFILLAVLFSVNNGSNLALENITNTPEGSKEERPEIGYTAPDFTYNNIKGEKVTLSGSRGKVVFLNIWATWCGPCKAEMPAIEKLYNRFKSDKFEVIAVSVDTQGMKVVEPYVKQMGLTFPILLDPDDTITYKYNTNALPKTFIIDRDGLIVFKVAGARDWSSENSLEAIEYLIKN